MFPSSPSSPQILLVEDDNDMRWLLRTALESEGYRVLGAAHGAEALEHLPSLSSPGLVLLDLTMPVMNGWEFLQALQDKPAFADLPVVVFSAWRYHALPKRVLAYFRKPLKLEELLSFLQRFFHTRPHA